MVRLVRTSKFRHVYGTAAKREACYEGLSISTDANDAHLVKVNPLFLSVHWAASGGGAFLILPLTAVGKIPWSPTETPLFNGHSAAVLDTDFNPFNDHVVASAGADGKVMVWKIPQGGPTETTTVPECLLTGHDRKVARVSFHPTADNVLASASVDLTVRVWDIERAACRQTLAGHIDAIVDLAWNYTGTLLATTSRDKMMRIFDVRANKVVQEHKVQDGVKGIKLAWMGSLDRIVTTGFSRTSDRQFAIWDITSPLSPLVKMHSLDTSSGLVIPYYDADTKMLYLGGKGDGNIRYYEIVDEAPFFHDLSEYKSTEPQRGLAFLPKRAVNVSENEIARAYKVVDNYVEPISFRVPRRQDTFQPDIYPDAISDQPAMTAEDFFDKQQTADPILVSLAGGFIPSCRREFSYSGDMLSRDGCSSVNSSFGLGSASLDHLPTSEKDFRDAYSRIKQENDELKHEVAQKNVRLRQLEALLAAQVSGANCGAVQNSESVKA